MFQLRTEHVHAFQDLSQKSFEDRALKSVRDAHSDQTSTRSDADLRSLIRERQHSASSYGLTTERQAMCFIHVSFLEGLRFDRANGPAWAAPILGSTMASDKKAAWILEIASAKSKTRSQREGAP